MRAQKRFHDWRRGSPTETGPTPRSAIGSESTGRQRVTLVGLLTLMSMLMWAALPIAQSAPAGASSPAAVDTAPAITQCNPPDFPITAGFQVTCTVTVVNTRTSTGATSSTVTTSACLAAAGVPFPSCPLNNGPVTSTTSSTQLVTSVNQCNGIVTGGGSNVYCNVTVTNNVPVGTPTSAVTVDQCIGSATGGGSTEACDPAGSTTSATVTQCNGSATGGGTYNGETTVGCTVTGAGSALPVTVNQCNGTATGGGSAVTCMTTMTNNFVIPTTTTTTAPTTTTTTKTTPTTTTTTAPSSTTTVPPAIPLGAPHTGAGGASPSIDSVWVALGVLALFTAGAVLSVALRRRRVVAGRDGLDRDE